MCINTDSAIIKCSAGNFKPEFPTPFRLFLCTTTLAHDHAYDSINIEPKEAGYRPDTCEDRTSHDCPDRPQHLDEVYLSGLGDILEHSCAFLALSPCEDDLMTILTELSTIFRRDQTVFVGLLVDVDNSSSSSAIATDNSLSSPVAWNSSSLIDKLTWKSARVDQSGEPPKLAFYERSPKDRTCLLIPPKSKFEAEAYSGRMIVETLVQFLNERCGAFRTPSGELTAAGLFHSHIMTHLYTPNEMTEDCKKIKMSQTADFFQEFFFRSRPVVIEGAIKEWPAMSKWTTEYLRELYGEKEIHIKLTEDGNFEGVESAKWWGNYRDDWIPDEVKKQLPFPDLVVVRPATAEMRFSDFLDFISTRNKSMYSAYLEYSSIPYYMPQLEKDISELPFLNRQLERRHLNMWLSDGNTLGKLHFDPYDNFLCQISGEKRLTLFAPHHNENLYEAHIPEAILTFSPATGKFSRNSLLQSTSMVMSPVDITAPNLSRFPDFARAKRVHCSLRPGDALFMPAFWWHEVQSFPDEVERRNLAVNFWYEPLLRKEFPCAKCRLEYNPFYRHFLYNPPGQ